MKEEFFSTGSNQDTQSLRNIYEDIKYELEDYLFILEQHLNKKSTANLLHKVKLVNKLSKDKSNFLKFPYIQHFTIQIRNIFTKIELTENKYFSFKPNDYKLLSICIDNFTNTLSNNSQKSSSSPLSKKIGEINSILDWGTPMAIELAESNFGKEVVTALTKQEQETWISVLNSAYKILERYTPNLYQEIINGLLVIIPVKSDLKSTSLSSTPEHPNGVMLASIVPPNEMAEALIHEWSHGVLNLEMSEHKLILDDTLLVYSPFRDDTRTPSGLLHAGFSFYNVCCLLKILKFSDERFATWVDSKITSYLIKVEYCLEVLITIPGALTKEGMDLCEKLLKNTRLISLDEWPSTKNQPIKEIKKHYRSWKIKAEGAEQNISDNVLNKVIENKFKHAASTQINGMNHPIQIDEKDLDFLRNNFKKISEPIIVKGKSLINTRKFQKEFNSIRETAIEIIDSKEYKGIDDPAIKRRMTLGEYSDSISDLSQKGKDQEFFVKTQFEKLLSNSIWKNDNFFNEFWFANKNTWLFMNPKDLSVVLHYDNCNNLHCLVKGEKEFFLSPPAKQFYGSRASSGFEDGFHQFNPFLNRDKANNFGCFVTMKADDMIYIPNGFWHAVSYKKDSISVSALDDINYTGYL